MLFIVSEARATETQQIFGVTVEYESKNEGDTEALGKTIRSLAKKLSVELDPDCKWRPKTDCKNTRTTESLASKLALEFREETLGFFDIHTGPETDYSGLSQGYFIDEVLKVKPKEMVVNFAGDIYFSGDFVPTKPFSISEPKSSVVDYAQVEWKNGGWMIASSAQGFGGKIIDPKTKKPSTQKDIATIVLFAKKDFLGSRLDAWSTAIVAGGLPVLRHLEGVKKYQNQWSYLYFKQDGRVKTGPGLKIEQKNSKSARILRILL